MLSLTLTHSPDTAESASTLTSNTLELQLIQPHILTHTHTHTVQVGDGHLALLLKCHCELTCSFLNFKSVHHNGDSEMLIY